MKRNHFTNWPNDEHAVGVVILIPYWNHDKKTIDLLMPGLSMTEAQGPAEHLWHCLLGLEAHESKAIASYDKVANLSWYRE